MKELKWQNLLAFLGLSKPSLKSLFTPTWSRPSLYTEGTPPRLAFSNTAPSANLPGARSLTCHQLSQLANQIFGKGSGNSRSEG